MEDVHFGIQMFLDLAKARVSPLSRVLVAGCGTDGREVIDIAKKSTWEVIGFDIALRSELDGACRDNWRLLRADVLQIPLPDAHVDAVLYYHVIEHVPDPSRSLRELAQVLRPGGGILLEPPTGRA